MKTKKIVSLLLAVLMACSVFAGLTVSAEEAAHTYTVVGDAAFLGASWAPATAADDMALREDGTYYKAYENPEAGNYNLKVAEDHDWANCFTGIDCGTGNYYFAVPEGTAKVEVILHITGTTEEGATAGYIEILVDGTAGAPPVITEETHYIAGNIAPGGWDPAADVNKMTKQDDGTYVFVLTGVAAGDYEFKCTSNGVWEPAYDLYDVIAPGAANATVSVASDDSTVKFVFNGKFVTVYINDEAVPTESRETTSKPEETTNDKGETSSITSHGGYYSPASGVETKRYYFYMPQGVKDSEGVEHDWYTFSNAMAVCYWWEGTDNCESLPIPEEFADVEGFGGWQMSYRMKSAGIKNVYYIDVPTDVTTIIFANGIDGGQKPDPEAGIEASPNWGKNYQTGNVACEYYDVGESDNYPNGTKTFNNMIYVPDVNAASVSDYSGATQYAGEWYALHADGTYDTTLVDGEVADPWVVPNIDVRLNKNAASVKVGETVTLTAEATKSGATVEWSTNNAAVATVDENGVVTTLAKGNATITCKVTNPADATDVAEANCVVTVTQPVKSVKVTGTASVYTGKTVTLKATVSPSNADNKTVTWSTSNKKIATVSSKGVVKGVKPGTVTITAKADGVKGTFKVTVKAQKATKVTVAKKVTIAKKGKTIKVKATLAPSNVYSKKINVTTDKKGKKIVKIGSKTITSGKTVAIKGLKKGSAKVTFTAADGSKKKAVCTVTVRK